MRLWLAIDASHVHVGDRTRVHVYACDHDLPKDETGNLVPYIDEEIFLTRPTYCQHGVVDVLVLHQLLEDIAMAYGQNMIPRNEAMHERLRQIDTKRKE
jgi:hypothetical protein